MQLDFFFCLRKEEKLNFDRKKRILKVVCVRACTKRHLWGKKPPVLLNMCSLEKFKCVIICCSSLKPILNFFLHLCVVPESFKQNMLYFSFLHDRVQANQSQCDTFT